MLQQHLGQQQLGQDYEGAQSWLLTTAFCCCCSEDHGPTRNLLTSQFLTPAELRQILQHCYGRCDRQGLMLAAMLALGVYNGFRSAAPLGLAWGKGLAWVFWRATEASPVGSCSVLLLAAAGSSQVPASLVACH